VNTTTLVVSQGEDFAVHLEAGNDRLDRWLAQRLPEHSRSAIQRWIKEGKVLVNNTPARANYRLSLGDTIRIEMPDPPRPAALAAEDIPPPTLFED